MLCRRDVISLANHRIFKQPMRVTCIGAVSSGAARLATNGAVMSGHNPYCSMRDAGGAYLDDKGILVFGSNYDNLKHRAKDRATTILIEEPEDYETALRDIESNTFGPKTIAVFDRSSDPDLLLPRLDDKINKVHLLFNVPKSLEEAKIVHDDASERLLSQYMGRFRSVSDAFRGLGGIKITSGESKADSWLTSYLSNVPKSDLVVIASHVEEFIGMSRGSDGMLRPIQKLMLPLVDGSKFELASIKGDDRPLIWTVGCNTWDVLSTGENLAAPELSISHPLEYQQSVAVVRNLLSGRESGRTMIAAIQKMELSQVQPSKSVARVVSRPSAPVRRNLKHFSPTRPKTKAQIIVYNIDGNNILTDQIGVA
jgi:hypothetical protein